MQLQSYFYCYYRGADVIRHSKARHNNALKQQTITICTVVPCVLILSKFFFIYQLMHKRIVLKGILKFTLKQLLHDSVQSPSSGCALFDFAKVIVVKIIN